MIPFPWYHANLVLRQNLHLWPLCGIKLKISQNIAVFRGFSKMVGRKPKPTKIKIIAGNLGKRPLPVAEAQPDPGVPECPDWMNADGRVEWERISTQLIDLGLLSLIDHAALEAYCQSYGRWVDAERRLQEAGTYVYKTPNGAYQTVPWVWVANKEREFMHKFLVEFGMTPSARTRVTPAGKDTAKKTNKWAM